MKIVQVLPTLSYGDAIGNHAIVLKRLIESMRFETAIYAENIDKRIPKGSGLPVENLYRLKESDVVLYHLSTETKLNGEIGRLNGRKIIQYHNITPPYFFSKYNLSTKNKMAQGLEEARCLADRVEYCLADSEFNKAELRKLGYKQEIEVMPILIDFTDYDQKASDTILKRCHGGKVNIVFVGRIAPNKKQEDIIKAFFYYKKFMNPESRLFLVGSYLGMERYYERLKAYVNKLELEDVYFTGHVLFNEILAYYKTADLFICMSEHEGFCVPLIEAMYFKVPIIAYDSSAVRETLGEGGILLREKKPKQTALWMKRLLEDKQLRNYVMEKQAQRLADFEYERVAESYRRYLMRLVGEEN